MKSGRSIACVVFVCVTAWPVCAALCAPPGDSPEAALVVVTSRYFDHEQGGNGFVIGDGTLVVTNDHIVYQNSDKGGHRLEGLVAVYSPYLGRACDARILAGDEELDLVVLEVPWRGHPAFSVADANTIKAAKVARVAGLPAVVWHMDKPQGDFDSEMLTIRDEQLTLSRRGLKDDVPSSVFLRGVGKLRPGWSGSPMFIPGTSQAIGCFGRITKMSGLLGKVLRWAHGPAVCHVPRILGPDFDRSRLIPAERPQESPGDAAEAFSLALRTATFVRPGRYESAPELARAFIRLRPQDAFGHKMVAHANDRLDEADAARSSYQRALELDPSSLHAQLLYAQFLGDHGDPNQVEPILERLWESGRSPGLVAIARVNYFGGQGRFDRCLEILEAAVKVRPRNAYLWYQTAACHLQTDGPEAMIEPLTRAVELYPERGPWRGGLARVLEETGALDQAEKHFRELLDVEAKNAVVYFWLARFLHEHRPEAATEALEAAENALQMPAAKTLPRARIEALIAEIRRDAPLMDDNVADDK